MRARRYWVLGGVIALGIGPAWMGVGCAAGVTADLRGGEGGEGGESSVPVVPDAGKDADTPDVDTSKPIPCASSFQCGVFNGPCTLGLCVDGLCQAAPANEYGACDDGIFCTEGDLCIAGACEGGPPKKCVSTDECHESVCDEALKTCAEVPANQGLSCDDGDKCTGAGVCSGGACLKGQQLDCSVFSGVCSLGACDPLVGCKPVPLNEGIGCDIGFNQCAFGQCMGGTCTPKPKNDGAPCEDNAFNPCTTGVCKNASCVSVPANDGMVCDDFQFCTSGEACDDGLCKNGKPTQCAPLTGCWIATCDEASDTCSSVPGNEGAACDDFNLCTEGTMCSNGACIAGSPVNEGMSCDDGTGCTSGESCAAGVCGGGAGPVVYFADDFKDASKGWLLGPEWQIGPAKASSGGVVGADPAQDHTSTSDNGVAGVVIGGNASTNVHGWYYLESPSFDTSAAAGPVVLGFYRWLNSDYTPFMDNAVHVWDGDEWIMLWQSGDPPSIEDSPPVGAGWTFIEHDLTSYKNAAMRIRFGFNVASAAVFTVGSWNVDDVMVANAACP